MDNDKALHEFILFAALDMFEVAIKKTNTPFLSIIDRYPTTTVLCSFLIYLFYKRYGDWMVSGYLSATGERLLLLHDVKLEDGIKQFFTEAHDLFTKFTLNPFYELGSEILSGPFEVKIRLMAKKYLEK